MDDFVSAIVAAFTSPVIVYEIGRVVIYCVTFGLLHGESYDKRNVDDITSFDLEKNEVSRETTYMVGFVAFFSMVGGVIYILMGALSI